MTNDLIILQAEISMRTSEEGGRKTGFASGYRPMIEPSETKTVTVRFLNVPEIQQYMQVGQKWFINEAYITLGIGEIIEIGEQLK